MSDTSLLYSIFAIDKASPTLSKLGGTWTKLALGVAGAAVVVGAKTTMMAANFQSQMNRLVTSAGETKGNLTMVGNGVLAMAGQVGDSSTQLTSALYTIESGGQHGAAGLIVLKAAAQGAKTENADLATVADAVTSVLQDYHLKASDAATVTSKLVAGVGAGKTTFQELAGSLHSVLPIASSAHISLGDIVGSLASMTVHGMSADQASQNLADTINHMVKPTQVQTKELGQLGIQSQDLAGMLGTKGISGTLQYLSQTILSKMGPSGKVLLGTFTQSSQAAANVKTMVASMPKPMQDLANQFIQGKITAGGWRASLKDLTPEQANQMQQFATLQKRATGFTSALAQGSPAAQTYQAALAAATGDATGLNTALMLTGENTAYTTNAVKTVTKATAEAGNNVRGWKDVQATFNQKLAEAKGTVEALGIKIGTALLPKVQGILGVTMSVVGWFTKHKSVSLDLAKAIGILAAGLLIYKGYLLGAAAVEKIGTGYLVAKKAVLGAIKGATIAYNAVQTLLNASLWTWIGVQAIDFAGWVRKTAVVVADTVVMYAQLAAVEAVSLATKVWAAAQWLINVAMDANPVGLIILGIAALVAIILYLWFHSKGFRTFFIGLWNDIWGWLKKVGAWFAGPFAGFFVDTYRKIKNGIVEAVLWLHTKIDDFVGFFKSLPGRISAASTRLWDGLKNSFKGAINWVIGAWNSLHFTMPAINTHIPGVGTVGGFTLRVPQLPKMATGGDITRAGMAWVGEKGPEPVYLPAGARVLPHSATAPGGRQRIEIVLSGDTPAIRALLAMLAAEIRGSFNGDVDLALAGNR